MNNALKLSGNMVDVEFGEAIDFEAPRYEIWVSYDDQNDNSVYSAKLGNSHYDDPKEAIEDAESLFKSLSLGDIDKYPSALSMTLTVDEIVDCEGEEMTIGSIFSKKLKK